MRLFGMLFNVVTIEVKLINSYLFVVKMASVEAIFVFGKEYLGMKIRTFC